MDSQGGTSPRAMQTEGKITRSYDSIPPTRDTESTASRQKLYQATRTAPPPPLGLQAQTPTTKDGLVVPATRQRSITPPLPMPPTTTTNTDEAKLQEQKKHHYDKHPYPKPPALLETNEHGINIGGGEHHPEGTRQVTKQPLGPNGKPLVQPQPGSKEDLRRKKAIKAEKERAEAAKQNMSPSSWYTASSNTVVTSLSQSAGAQGPTASSSRSGSASSGSNSSRLSPYYNAERPSSSSTSSSSGLNSIRSFGNEVPGERVRTSLISQSRQPGLIVEEDEDDVEGNRPTTPTPPGLRIERERALARMKLAQKKAAGSQRDGVTGSDDESDALDQAEMQATVVLKAEVALPDEDQSVLRTARPAQFTTEAEIDDIGSSPGSLTVAGTEKEGSLITPTNPEFEKHDANSDSNISIPTIISSSADDDEPEQGEKNGLVGPELFQTLVKALPSQLGKTRIVSDIGKRLSTIGLGGFMSRDTSEAGTPSGSRRPSFASSAGGSEADAPEGPALPKGALGKAVHEDLWKPDHLSEVCDFPTCKAEFAFRIRKHHCRHCGGIFCGPHSAFELPLYFPPVEGDDGRPISRQGSRHGSSVSLAGLVSRATDWVADSRVCVTCFEKLAHPERLLARRAAAKGIKHRPLILHDDSGLPSTDEDSDDEDDESYTEYEARRQQRSQKAPTRRMFSAPPTPLSTSPTSVANEGVSRTSSISNSPIVSRRASKVRSQGSRSQSRVHSRSGTMLSRQASITSAASKIFSPTAEALNTSPAPDGTGRNCYFPTLSAAPSLDHLPGEEPNSVVTGVLASYPLAHKRAVSPGSVHSPVTEPLSSQISLGAIAGPGRPASKTNSRDSSASRNGLTLNNMPSHGFGTVDQFNSRWQIYTANGSSTHTTTSSAGILTPDREWVPSAWGYDKQTFDPDVETDTEDEDGHNRGRPRLVVDGDFRLKANPHDYPQQPSDEEETTKPLSTSLAWATF